MKRVLALGVCAVVLAGCYRFVDARIRESAAIDYAVVKATLEGIDSGEVDADAAVEVLRGLERSMRGRVSYFEGTKPDDPRVAEDGNEEGANESR